MMEKCLLSQRDLFPTVLATLLLLLIYAQSIYSDDGQQPILVLDDHEVNTLRNVLIELNQRPLPKIDKFLCSDNSSRIHCNCRVNKPEPKCDDEKKVCRDHTTCYVSSINLSGQQLDGEIKSSIQSLIYLEDLDFSSNYLKGSLPKELGSLKNLKRLDLRGNIFNGSIPSQWSNLQRAKLEKLFLTGNRLSGQFPSVLTDLTNLKTLLIGSNNFSGTIPPELGNLVNLIRLDVSSNQFTGELPAALAKLTKLTDMRISDNNFSGRIPDFISNWANIKTLHIHGSSLEGPIPTSISALESLRDLRISDLKGRGSYFPLLSKMVFMETLILRNCKIHGNIPEYIVNMIELDHLDLSFNYLTGEIPSSFAKLAKVDFIYFTGNMLTGPIPEWILRRNKIVDVSYNNFSWESSSGPLECPAHGIVNLVESYSNSSTQNNLIHPCLKKNFPCVAPSNRYQSSLYINCGGGEVVLMSDDTKYEADMEQRGASMFYLAKGWAFSSTGIFMDIDEEKYIVANTSILSNVSALNSDLYTTARISPLSLTYYGLCLINGNYTVKLHFAEIVYNETYYNHGKRMFDVYIQGELVLKDFNIEDEAGGINKPIVKNFTAVVASNTLKIQLYWAGKGTTGKPISGLYGPLISAISVDPNFKTGANKTSSKLLVAVSVSALFLIVLVLGISWEKDWFGGKAPIDVKVSLTHGNVYNFPQLKEATRNFHPNNKIGQGDFGRVYKGVLANGEEIAVKQLNSNTKEGKQEFLNEVGIISAVNHPNLVKLLGCCTENNQLLLVYEYMENNSLSSALFGTGNLNLKSRLNWAIRFEICLGIAKGLAFLHEDSKRTHRDIKPTNILLDKDLKAKISDFGLAGYHEEEQPHQTKVGGYSSALFGTGNLNLKSRLNWAISRFEICFGIAEGLAFLHEESSLEISDFGLARHHEEEQPHQTKVGGTSCYVAPEYAMHGHLTYKVDVYSFGVVMLEILSGKANTDYRPNDETAFLLDRANVLHQQGNLLELMDPDLKMDYKVNQANRMLNLAMLCTNRAPAVRPKMSEVVSILKGKTKLMSVPIVAPYSADGFQKASAVAEKSGALNAEPKASLRKTKSF